MAKVMKTSHRLRKSLINLLESPNYPVKRRATDQANKHEPLRKGVLTREFVPATSMSAHNAYSDMVRDYRMLPRDNVFANLRACVMVLRSARRRQRRSCCSALACRSDARLCRASMNVEQWRRAVLRRRNNEPALCCGACEKRYAVPRGGYRQQLCMAGNGWRHAAWQAASHAWLLLASPFHGVRAVPSSIRPLTFQCAVHATIVARTRDNV